MQKYVLLTYVLNKPGVLNKVSGLLRRKMYNIDTLTVSDTGNPDISGMTITFTTDTPTKVKQMMQQIGKMTEVICIKELDPETSFWREVAIVKCGLKLSKLEYIIRNYNAEILYEDDEQKVAILQIAGTSRKIDACLGEITMKNILDISRTGVTSMEIEGVSPDFSFRKEKAAIDKITNF